MSRLIYISKCRCRRVSLKTPESITISYYSLHGAICSVRIGIEKIMMPVERGSKRPSLFGDCCHIETRVSDGAVEHSVVPDVYDTFLNVGISANSPAGTP